MIGDKRRIVEPVARFIEANVLRALPPIVPATPNIFLNADIFISRLSDL
jgi:hypothetical protein